MDDQPKGLYLTVIKDGRIEHQEFLKGMELFRPDDEPVFPESYTARFRRNWDRAFGKVDGESPE